MVFPPIFLKQNNIYIYVYIIKKCIYIYIVSISGSLEPSAMEKTLVVQGRTGIIPPCYVLIIGNHYKDPY